MTPLYAIVDVDVCRAGGRDPAETAEAILAAGVSHLQIRAKTLGAAAFLALVERVAESARPAGAVVVVNDRVDVARCAGVGVHLGQTDLSVAAARTVLGPDAVIGRSTHSPRELEAALGEAATYVAYGPVFATRTKANPDPVVGLPGIVSAAARVRQDGRPLVAIGGITLETAAAVRAAGADQVAVIGDLVAGPDAPGDRARRFLRALSVEPV
ncbi:MAG: thiamine phosphate synthase [Vicinamibacterales bacterium]